MKIIYETADGKGGWRGRYEVKSETGYQGQWLWVPVKRFLWFWVRDKKYMEFWDWPVLFRPSMDAMGGPPLTLIAVVILLMWAIGYCVAEVALP
jgi:hypothetical protein